MFKWYGWIMIYILVAALLVGCGAAQAPEVVTEVVTREVTAAPAEPEPGVYYWLAANNSDPFYVTGLKGWNDAAKELNINVEFVGPMDLNLAEQMKTFDTLVNSPDTKGIFYYPMDFNAAQPYIEAAESKGIPVIIGALDSPFKDRSGFIGYDYSIFGTQAGAWIAKLTECKGVVGSVSNLTVAVLPRLDAMEEYLRQTCPDIKIVERVGHDGSAASAEAAMDAYLVANPDLTLVWFADGLAGQLAGYWKDKQDQGVETMFLATDMPPAVIEAVEEGVFIGSTAADTYAEEYWGLKALHAKANGVRIPDTFYLSAIFLDKDNVDQFK